MQPRIENVAEKRLIGKRVVMSFAENRDVELWRSFMPRRKKIRNVIGTDLYCIQVYDNMDFKTFDPNIKFEKWAAVEVTDFAAVPQGMEAITLPAGLYAVFLYKGAASAAVEFFQYVFQTWLPNSDFSLDNRPHFDVLGQKYENEDPSSEEDICIPIKNRGHRPLL
jgi:AraC family transcriptional regulator